MTAPKFGTSGLRGLVEGLTPEVIAEYIRAFVRSCPTGGAIWIGQDLRPSSPRMAADITAAALSEGIDVVDCGALPTPALALAAMQAGAAAIMVTGSHIPADRNGLKFYTPQGEITKEHEEAILAHLGQPARAEGVQGSASRRPNAAEAYVQRYLAHFSANSIAGKRIGLYAHSSVGRDLLAQILTGLGAEVIELGRSDHFIPVDTEAVDEATRAQIRDWVQAHQLDALVSTDGDSDRPLLADELGAIVPGDVMGQITSEALGADVVVTPISSNSGVSQKGFAKVVLTQIGSPYVIAAMQENAGKVVGYEANGGYLLGFEAGKLAPLPTRDAVLPLLQVLCQPGPISACVAREPRVMTVADRLQNIAPEISGPWLQMLRESDTLRAAILADLQQVELSQNCIDGLRLTLEGGKVLHLRPSGNAPEFRIYVEAANSETAHELLKSATTLIDSLLRD